MPRVCTDRCLVKETRLNLLYSLVLLTQTIETPKKRHNECLRRHCVTALLDRDQNEMEAECVNLTLARLFLCIFHVLKYFKICVPQM